MFCSHRCLKLVDEKNIGKLIRCPYHSWTYDLQGNLKAAHTLEEQYT